jgi:hypothetical protein
MIAAYLVLFSAVTVRSQHMHPATAEKMQGMMGKSTGEQVVDGLKVQLWVIPQAEHEKMMQKTMKDSASTKGMHHGMTGMMNMKHGSGGCGDSAMVSNHKATMMTGTHHLMIMILDADTGLEVNTAEVKLHILTPTQNHLSAELMKMKNHYGAGISFNEQGKYMLHAQITKEGKEYQAVFTYEQK